MKLLESFIPVVISWHGYSLMYALSTNHHLLLECSNELHKQSLITKTRAILNFLIWLFCFITLFATNFHWAYSSYACTFNCQITKQEAFEKCWAHLPLQPLHAACSNFTLPFTRCRYCRTPPALISMSTTTTTTTTTRDRGDRYGPIEWAQ